MKNIIEEKPTDPLYGRSLYNTRFVLDNDIENKDILDIGCGFGWFELNAIQRKCKSITGTEITQKDLKTAKKYINDPKVRLITGSAIKLPVENKMFDTVVSWEVLEHIPKGTEDEMFKEVHRVLKDKGDFYLSTPFASFFGKFLDPAWWLIGHRHYTIEDLESLATNNGFNIEQMSIRGGWWEMIGMWDLYISKWVFRRKPLLKDLVVKRQNGEFEKDNGFTNIFVKMRKLS